MPHPFNPLFRSPVARLRVTPDDPAAIVGPRPKHSRRPHTDATVAAVRRLIEESVLTYGEIAAKTGVGRASICRWTRDGRWKRPLFAPRATDTVPRDRASAQLQRRTLAARLAALAERYVRELEAAPDIDLDKLSDAFELMKMSKAAAKPRKRRGTRAPLVPAQAGTQSEACVQAKAGTQHEASTPVVPAKAGTQGQQPHEQASLDSRWSLCPGQPEAGSGYGNEREAPSLHEASPRAVMRGLRAAGVRVERAPEDALCDFIDSSAPKPERLTKKQREHRRMLGRG